MIGEKRAAQSREPSWQRIFQSLSPYSFRFVTSRSPSQTARELMTTASPGNGKRTHRSPKREMEVWTRPCHHRPNYPSGSRARFKGLVATALLPQRIDPQGLICFNFFPPFGSIFLIPSSRVPSFAPVNAIIRMLPWLALDLILYLPHLYSHNPIRRCDIGHVTYIVQKYASKFLRSMMHRMTQSNSQLGTLTILSVGYGL